MQRLDAFDDQQEDLCEILAAFATNGAFLGLAMAIGLGEKQKSSLMYHAIMERFGMEEECLGF